MHVSTGFIVPAWLSAILRVAGRGWACLGMVTMTWGASAPAERLDRGVVAVGHDEGVVVSWRWLGRDPDDVRFNLYRETRADGLRRLNQAPLDSVTWFLDPTPPPTGDVVYHVRPWRNGREDDPSRPFVLSESARHAAYLTLPLQTPAGYRPNDASVGDLDGDGEYEIVLHQAGRGRDNSQPGITDPPILQAYELDGTRRWEIRLGPNIREGAHYTQFIVFDLDGDGRAEVACKTADGTIDGEGRVLGDARADHVAKEGRVAGKILEGPEFLTIFDGRTGAALATTNYVPPRGRVADWGDDYGNRVDRFLAGVGYLDGERPSLIMARGYYTRTVLAAWDWREGRLSLRWVFDSDDGTPGNEAYRGQGNHSLSLGDVDGDGRDEILYGACCIDDTGRGLYSTGLGHGDAQHLGDLDPQRPGLEVFSIHERPSHPHGVSFRDARSGRILWSAPSPDVGRGLAIDLDPRHPGAECWAAGQGLEGLFSSRGERIAGRRPRSCNFAVWWDGDRLRELLDRDRIAKWDWTNEVEVPLLVAEGCVAINGTKATPCLSADLVGDWREEVLWPTADGTQLRIYTTPHPTPHRVRTLMEDRQYRLAVASQNVGYNQPPHPSFFLGEEEPGK